MPISAKKWKAILREFSSQMPEDFDVSNVVDVPINDDERAEVEALASECWEARKTLWRQCDAARSLKQVDDKFVILAERPEEGGPERIKAMYDKMDVERAAVGLPPVTRSL